jgi:hypothetical protein
MFGSRRRERGRRGGGNAGPVTVTFATPEADAEYAVFVETSFLSQRAITARTPEGFTVQFETAPSADGRIDWVLVR